MVGSWHSFYSLAEAFTYVFDNLAVFFTATAYVDICLFFHWVIVDLIIGFGTLYAQIRISFTSVSLKYLLN